MSPSALARRPARLLAQAWLALDPHGGQERARRNAWAAMSADLVAARARQEAEQAVAAAQRTAERARDAGAQRPASADR